MGVKVIFGGIAAMLHAEETLAHADAVFLGEAEGRMEEVFADFRTGRSSRSTTISTTGPRSRAWPGAP